MMDMEFYADGDGVLVEATVTSLDRVLVDVTSATVQVRRSASTREADWAKGTVMQAADAMANFGTGIYRYNWDTTNAHAGFYVAEVKVVRGAITNVQRGLFELV
jgi:hypothetical protein